MTSLVEATWGNTCSPMYTKPLTPGRLVWSYKPDLWAGDRVLLSSLDFQTDVYLFWTQNVKCLRNFGNLGIKIVCDAGDVPA